MNRLLHKLRSAFARLRRFVAAHLRRLADRLDDRRDQDIDRIDAPVAASKSQGVVS